MRIAARRVVLELGKDLQTRNNDIGFSRWFGHAESLASMCSWSHGRREDCREPNDRQALGMDDPN